MATPTLEWDMDTVPGFVDATCDCQGVETDIGPPDDSGVFPAGVAVIQLDNSQGAWSQYNADGSPANYGPGTEVALWARYRDDGEEFWIFRGRVSKWDDLGSTVEVEVVDAFSDLAQGIGTYTPGVNGQTPAARLAAIQTAAGKTGIPTKYSTGDVTLTAQATDNSPLEEMQIVVGSDGGSLFVDFDGTLVSTRRNWRNGRADQTAIPVASANVCTADLVVWDAILSTNDASVADTVILENVAGLKAQSPAGAIGRYVVTETDQQWTLQSEGESLAAYMWAAQQAVRVNVESFDMHLLDPNQPDMVTAVEWRLFDVLRFLHNYKAAGNVEARLDMNLIITAVAHSIVPGSGWVMSVATSKALAANAMLQWNPTGDPYWWDAAGYTWGYQ